MLYRKEANSRDRKSNIEKGGGGSIVDMRKEICLKYSNMTKCLNTFVAHCSNYSSLFSFLLIRDMSKRALSNGDRTKGVSLVCQFF